MHAPLARTILVLGIDERDKVRMQNLAGRNHEGALSPQKKEGLWHYVKPGHLLALQQRPENHSPRRFRN
jgi:hypothetical protein